MFDYLTSSFGLSWDGTVMETFDLGHTMSVWWIDKTGQLWQRTDGRIRVSDHTGVVRMIEPDVQDPRRPAVSFVNGRVIGFVDETREEVDALAKAAEGKTLWW